MVSKGLLGSVHARGADGAARRPYLVIREIRVIRGSKNKKGAVGTAPFAKPIVDR